MKLVIGFITYGNATAKYLPYFLDSIFKQNILDFKVIVFDNTEEKDNKNQQIIKEKYSQIELDWNGKNIGFARAYNRMILKAERSGAEFFLMLNPDMIIEPDMLSKLLTEIQKDDKIAVATPKILKWDFENKQKTSIIDSCGLYITEEHRFSDLKQGEVDNEKVVKASEVFGFTGAAALVRMKALEDVMYHKESFDSLMFMYKEDCDLSYRLQLAGWKIVLVPTAVAYHDRTASQKGESNFRVIKNRKNKSRQVKIWSFLNHWIIIMKYWNLSYSNRVKYKTVWYQLKSVVYALIFEPYLLREFRTLWRSRNIIKDKAKNLKIRVSTKEIEKFMIK